MRGKDMSSTAELMDEIDGDLGLMESRVEAVKAGKSILRQVDRLVTAVDEFEKSYFELPNGGYDMTWADELEAELDKGSVDSVGEKVATLASALGAAQLIGLTDDEVARGLDIVARYQAAKDAKSAKGNAFAPGSSRNLGVPIEVVCSCGDFHSRSTNGDWSSIRYAAKSHAETCDRANPGLSAALVNDLDRVRESIVTKRENTESGGLSFTVGEA